jgi:hypothetical protein
MAACMDCKTSGRYQDKQYTFDSVEELTEVSRGGTCLRGEASSLVSQVLRSEIADLAAQEEPLTEQLNEFEGSLEEFQRKSQLRSNGFKDEMVHYMQHYLKVCWGADKSLLRGHGH